MTRKIILLVLVVTLMLTACGGKTTRKVRVPTDNPSTEATAAPQEANNDNKNSSPDDLSNALNLLLGTTDQPSVFDSYHMEMVLDTPKANDDDSVVVNEVVSISADVAGKNIHIFQIDPGMTEAKEGYIIGGNDTEFKWVDGAWEQTMGQIALAWVMWPLQVVVPYATITSLYAQKAGSEEINGRSANVYDLDTSKADPATLAGMKAVGVNITGKGQVWIDKQTGAMLKLDLEYSNDILTGDASKVIGPGNGHITIEISKVGEVTVTSPQ